MKYNVLVEMDDQANIDLLIKAMSIMESVPHVTGVSLVGVDAAEKETMHKFRLNKMVASLESMIRDLKSEIYITFDTAIMKAEGVQDVDSCKKKEDLKRINLYYLIEAYCEDYFNLENSCQKCPFHLPVAVPLPDGNATICMKPFILWNRENKNEE